jgi:hypothetical protein
MTKFGMFLISVFTGAFWIGFGNGIWCIWRHEAAGAYVSGVLTAAPFFMIVGRAWLRGELQQ